MHARQAPLQRGGRLPPTPDSERPSLGLRSLLQPYGNAAMQERLAGRAPTGGDFQTQRFEDIGESDDEVVVGGTLPGVPQTDDADFLFGHGAVDDGSLKFDAGLHRPKGDNGISLATAKGQSGVWYDDEGNLNLGGGGEFALVDGQYDFWGDESEDDGYLRVEGSLLKGSGAGRIGTDGVDVGGSGHVAALGIAAGTGASKDRWWDSGIAIGGSLGSGGSQAGVTLTDVDGDGVSELNLSGCIGFQGGASIDVSSELLGAAWDATTAWWTGGEG